VVVVLSEQSDRATWRAWCEHEDCDWEMETTEKNALLAQKVTGAAMAGHGIESGHHETKRKEVDSTDD